MAPGACLLLQIAAAATAPIAMGCASPTAESITTIQTSASPVVSTTPVAFGLLSPLAGSRQPDTAVYRAIPARAPGAAARRLRNAPDIGKPNAAANAKPSNTISLGVFFERVL